MITGAPQRTLEPAVRRTQILRAAAEVFGQTGFHTARISDIAERAGVAQGTIYRFFESKEDLAAALVSAGLEQMKALAGVTLAEAVAAGEPEKALDRFIEAAAEHYARHRTGLRALHSWTSERSTTEMTAGADEELHAVLRKLIKLAGKRVWRPKGVELSRLLLLMLYSLSAEQERYRTSIGDHQTVARIVQKTFLVEV